MNVSSYLQMELEYSIHLDRLPKSYEQRKTSYVRTPNYVWLKSEQEESIVSSHVVLRINHEHKTVSLYPAMGELDASKHQLPMDSLFNSFPGVSVSNNSTGPIRSYKIDYPDNARFEKAIIQVDSKAKKLTQIEIKNRNNAFVNGKEHEVYGKIKFYKVSYAKPQYKIEAILNSVYVQNGNGIQLTNKYREYQLLNYLK